MTEQTQTLERPVEAAYAAISDEHSEPDWLRNRRSAAWQTFQRMPMPSMDQEDWRRTDLRGLKLDQFKLYSPHAKVTSWEQLPAALTAASAPGDFAAVSVQVDSTSVFRDQPETSGVIFTDVHTAARENQELLQRCLEDEDAPSPDSDKFAAMSAALAAGGNFIYVPDGVHIEKPIKCTYWLESPEVALFPRTTVVLGREASVVLIDEYLSADGPDSALAVPVTQAHIGPFANLDYVSLQRFGDNTWNISRQRFVFAEEAKASLLFAALGAGTTKAYVDTIFKGNASRAQLKGLIVADGKQHVDYQTLQQHAGVASESDLDFKAALRGESRAIWPGLCKIDKSGQRSNANQTCRNLLLSRNAGAFPIPSLEILANDVKCSHGTTVGQVDEQQIFYAMTR
ncbi:MAG TPA: SufD family Fe-S cluster assembly protein, partial [Dehalococcoidia bacterium]|nr:SufD family Fe-S cluster assembly protein [Dehalococcoidia bacterium]